MENGAIGPVRMVVLQGTSLCNLNCSYCYLTPEDRRSRRTLSLETIEAVFANLFSSPYATEDLTVLWHTGEPLTLPVGYYRDAIGLIARLQREHRSPELAVRHTIQTNGTLVTQEWCDFFKAHGVTVGLSCDGPPETHDHYRVDWRGSGSFERLRRGMELLQRNGIELHLLCTVHPATLREPDRFIDFIFENGFHSVMLNPVGRMAHNTEDHLGATPELDRRYRELLVRILRRQEAERTGPRIKVFDLILNSIFFDSIVEPPYTSDNHPLWLLTVDWEGNFTTFSPQFLTAKSPHYGDFVLGNLRRDPLESAVRSEKFLRLWSDIEAGVALCRSECGYYSLCGGGQPCVKYSEKGTFHTTETDDCRYRVKIPADVVLDELESLAGAGVAGSASLREPA